MKILHLYYDLMNLYGEYGNVVVLKKHLKDQGFDVELIKKTIDDKIDFCDYDFIYCGSGTERNCEIARIDILKRKDSLMEAIEKGTVVLFTGNAMELLGQYIDDKAALKIGSFESKLTKNRFTGDVIVTNNKIGEVVGFINKCSIISRNEENKLFKYIFKDSGIKDNDFEGFNIGKVYGTHLIGPVLVKNPNFMKLIVNEICLKNKADFIYKDITYKYEEDSYNVTLNALKERMNSH